MGLRINPQKNTSMKLTQLKDINISRVSHNAVITKKIMIGNGEIPHITNFSIATFPAGEIAPAHSHADMTEVFFVQSGYGEISINNQIFTLETGTCITVEPNEVHELRNTSDADLVVMYYGVKV